MSDKNKLKKNASIWIKLIIAPIMISVMFVGLIFNSIWISVKVVVYLLRFDK